MGIHFIMIFPCVILSDVKTHDVCVLSLRSSLLYQRVADWEAVLKRAKGIFLKCPPRELVLHAPAYIKETLSAGG